jgi:hypothetical protein
MAETILETADGVCPITFMFAGFKVLFIGFPRGGRLFSF